MDGKIVVGTDIDTKSFDAQIDYIESRMEDIEDKLKQADMGFEVGDTEKLEAEYEKLGNQLIGLREKQEKFNQSIREAQTAGFERIKDSIDSVGSKLTSVTKKVGRWALAVFGVRSAYMFVRNAINTISQNDEKLANDIHAVKTALAYTIEPIVRRIVELAKTLMSYVAYIVKAWTGRDIFASASKNLKSANKSAKELQKSSASFDKFNKLSSNSSSGGSGGSAGGLQTPEDADVPKWIKWIAENKEIIIGALAGIALGLLAIKLADPTAWIVLAIALLAGLVTAIIANWDKIKDVLSKVGDWINQNVIQPVVNVFVWLWNTLVKIFTPIIDFFKNIFTTVWQNIKTIFENIAKIFIWAWDKLKEIFSPIVEYFGNIFKEAVGTLQPFIDAIVGLWDKVKNSLKKFGAKVGEVIGNAFKTTFNGIMKVIETFLNAPIKAINGLINIINKVPGIDLTKLSEFKLPRLARGGIVNQPGRGVMMGSYVAGEKGPEAVIPLNDETMSRLGNAIAKKITVNADITLELESRVLARVMQEINNNAKFARNGG